MFLLKLFFCKLEPDTFDRAPTSRSFFFSFSASFSLILLLVSSYIFSSLFASDQTILENTV